VFEQLQTKHSQTLYINLDEQLPQSFNKRSTNLDLTSPQCIFQ